MNSSETVRRFYSHSPANDGDEEEHKRETEHRRTQRTAKSDTNERARIRVYTIYSRIEVVHKVWLTWRPRRENCEKCSTMTIDDDAMFGLRIDKQACGRYTLFCCVWWGRCAVVCAHGELVTGRWIYISRRVCASTTMHFVSRFPRVFPLLFCVPFFCQRPFFPSAPLLSFPVCAN